MFGVTRPGKSKVEAGKTRETQWQRTARGFISLTFAAALVAVAVSGCGREAPEPQVELAAIDSILAELGGTTAASLERGQRWRMISSIGAGLPPADYVAEDLPEPGSRGAGLLQVYCIQCHWLPSPRMHSADEWSILMPRMLLRARTLKYRLGGPLTTGLVGEALMAGLTTAELPSPEQVDSMVAYLQANALPVIEPDELSQGPGRDLYVARCSVCHETPSPKAHTAAGWDGIVKRMRAIMVVMDVEPLDDREFDRILAYVKSASAR